MMIGLAIVGALAAAYGAFGYLTGATVLQQQAAGHFIVAGAVLIGCAGVIEAVDRAGKSITGQLRKLREEAAPAERADPPPAAGNV